MALKVTLFSSHQKRRGVFLANISEDGISSSSTAEDRGSGKSMTQETHGNEVLLQPCWSIPASHKEPTSIGLGVSFKRIHT